MSQTVFTPSAIEPLEPRLLLSNTIVQFDTAMGSFQVELFDTETPATVANFLGYVNRGDYNTTLIHRSIPGFIVQGGGYDWPSVEHIPTQPPVVNEPGISNTRGTIAMAKLGGQPNSATSEWFVNLNDENATNLDVQNEGFTVFGRVLDDGMDVVDAIAGLPTFDFGDAFTDLPLRNYDNDDYTQGVPPEDDNVVLVNTVTVISTPPPPPDPGFIDVPIGQGAPARAQFVDPDGTLGTIAMIGGTGRRPLPVGNAVIRFTGEGLQQQVVGQNVTITGNNVQVQAINVVNAHRQAALGVSGRGGDGLIDVQQITSNATMRAINAPGVRLNGDLTVNGTVSALALGATNGSLITVGQGRAMNVRIDSATDTSLQSATGIQTLHTGHWLDTDGTPNWISTPWIGNMIVRGHMDANMNLFDPGPRAALGTARVVEHIRGGNWQLAGRAGSIHAGEILPGWTAEVAGPVNNVQVAGNASGRLTAEWLNSMIVRGNYYDGNMALSQPAQPGRPALGRLGVWGIISSTNIIAQGNVGPVHASGMHNSRIFSGVGALPAGQPLPASAADFVTQSWIANVTLRPGSTFVNSNIAAPVLGQMNLQTVQTNNAGMAHGLAAQRIQHLVFIPQGGNQLRFAQLTDQAALNQFLANAGVDLQDFQIRLL
jgi:peptidyl-prolyl cis-trans isomerase A (cyclophilin A)